MAHFLNMKMWGKDLCYILFKMRMKNKLYKINFELEVYLQIVLQLEKFSCKLYN